MSPPRPHPQDDAPGRIPESLIDSVLDGSVDERTRREIARALRHDPRHRQEVSETIEAIDALRGPVSCPDLSAGVLSTLDRRHRFLSPKARRLVRRARLSGVLAVLAGLLAAAGLQRTAPRFASLSAQPTPVTDIAQAVQTETTEAAGRVRESVRVMQASLPSLSASMDMPGQQHRMRAEVEIARTVASHGEHRVRLITINGGRYFLLEPIGVSRSSPNGGGFVASMSATVNATAPDAGATEEPFGSSPLP